MLNLRTYTNNIYGSDDIRDESYIDKRIELSIKSILEKKINRLALYPMGNIGRRVCMYLNSLGLDMDVLLIDDELCAYSENIISIDDFLKDKEYLDFHLLLCSNNVKIYEKIRNKLKNLECNKYTDIFALKPLYKKDSRIIALELASREIYRYAVKGAVAEVGVYRGYFAEYINHFFPDRHFYLLDTFEGFDERDIVIEHNNGYSSFTANSCFLDTSETIVLDKMENPENCECIKGYFPESSEKIHEEEFCFVHLDTDLYLPTFNGLMYFYPKLSHGGYIFVHDFNGEAQGVRTAVKEFCDRYNIGYVCLPDSIVKGTIVITK